MVLVIFLGNGGKEDHPGIFPFLCPSSFSFVFFNPLLVFWSIFELIWNIFLNFLILVVAVIVSFWGIFVISSLERLSTLWKWTTSMTDRLVHFKGKISTFAGSDLPWSAALSQLCLSFLGFFVLSFFLSSFPLSVLAILHSILKVLS